jgi:ribosomal protein S18 acetylase RimI-like enzyme
LPEWIVSAGEASDLADIARLVNSAYRGASSEAGWTSEARLLGGQRTDPDALAEEIADPDNGRILCLRKAEGGGVIACVSLKRVDDGGAGYAYVGMVTVEPTLQDRGLGRVMLGAAEDQARAWGLARARMTVISLRESLIAWYERRGYARTGEREPFPYGDARFGLPRRDDLEFVVLEKAL